MIIVVACCQTTIDNRYINKTRSLIMTTQRNARQALETAYPDRYLKDTLDQIEHEDIRNNKFRFADFGDLQNYADRLDAENRQKLADDEAFEQRYKAQKRLIRILTGALLRAVRDDDYGVAEFMADRIRHHTYNLGDV